MKMIFFSPNKEVNYQAHLAFEKIKMARTTNVVAVILFLAFGVLDVWAFPSTVYAIWLIRLMVVFLAALVFFGTRFENFFAKHYATITSFQYAFFGCAINGMIYFAQPGGAARTVYLSGILLVTVAMYSWTFLPARLVVPVGSLLIATYVCVVVWIQNPRLPVEQSVLIANCFSLAGANVIGFVSIRRRDRFFRENYLLWKSLQRELRLTQIAKEHSDFLALHDLLTGLPNRLSLIRDVTGMIDSMTGQHSTVAVFFIDLDGFKEINDTYGHNMGDFVLRTLSGRLEACTRYGDVIARLGGDEFVAAAPISTQRVAENIQQISNRVMSTLAQPVIVNNVEMRVSASIGVAVYPHHGRDADTLIAMADKQMYFAKLAGKNRISIAINNILEKE
jgi:diguanylate cyclase (GGDEF)-like protein